MPSIPFPGRRFAAFLFDMDGTLVSSIAAAERVWTRWARGHGLDAQALLPTIHGVRAVETIRRLGLPGVDPEAEAEAIARAEIADVAGVVEIAGAGALLAALPPARWAVVTSAPRALAERRLAAAGLPVPRVLVSAEDVAHGKPAPDCYLAAAERLGAAAADCLVFEDAVAGVRAAEAAGAAVAIVTATHAKPLAGPVEAAHPTIADYRGLRVEADAAALWLAAATGR